MPDPATARIPPEQLEGWNPFRHRRDQHKGYPSSTEVLGLYSDLSQIPTAVLNNAARRGTQVHEICAAQALGVPYFGEIPTDCAGYVLSFEAWFEAMVEEVLLVEERLYDHDLGYCGQVDLVARLRGDPGLAVIDLKTPVNEYVTWGAQLASYQNLVVKAGFDARRVLTLRLDKNGGRAKPTEYTDPNRDMQAFVAALTAYRYFIMRG